MAQTFPNFRPLGLLLVFLSISLPSSRAQTPQAYHGSVRKAGAVEPTVQTAALGFLLEPLQTSRREDLQELLSAAGKQPGGDIDFYQMQSPPGPAFDYDPVWIVAVARSTGDVFRLSGFDPSLPLSGPGQEFNRLTSRLALSISTDQEALSLAKLFMECCAVGERSEIVVDEDGLRRAVQDDYFKAYGDVWRMLDAYVEWWNASKVNAPGLLPGISFRNGRFSIVLKRALLAAGRTPQLQNCNLEVSRDGSVRLLAIQPVFPKAAGWLFYDFAKPSFCYKPREKPYPTTLGCETLPGAWYGLEAAMAGDKAKPWIGVLGKGAAQVPSDLGGHKPSGLALPEDLLHAARRFLPSNAPTK